MTWRRLTDGTDRRDVQVGCAVLRVRDRRRSIHGAGDTVMALHVRRWQRQLGVYSSTTACRSSATRKGRVDDRRGIRPLRRACVGKGPTREESLGRGSRSGIVDAVSDDTRRGSSAADAVAPSLAFTSASAKKLRRPAGAYSIHVALSLRDDVEGNTVAYRLSVTGGPEASTRSPTTRARQQEGSTASGSVSTTLRVLPSSKRVRSVQLRAERLGSRR